MESARYRRPDNRKNNYGAFRFKKPLLRNRADIFVYTLCMRSADKINIEIDELSRLFPAPLEKKKGGLSSCTF